MAPKKCFMCLFVCCALFQCYSIVSAQEKPTYTTKYDYINIDAVLKNERIMRRLVDCILDRGRCTREGLELKAIVPDALKTECSKCSTMQKRHVGRVLAYLLMYKKDYWDELAAKFDPDGSYRKKYGFTVDKISTSPNSNLIKPSKTIKKTVSTAQKTLKVAKKRMTREEKKEMVRKRFPQLNLPPNMWVSSIQKIRRPIRNATVTVSPTKVTDKAR